MIGRDFTRVDDYLAVAEGLPSAGDWLDGLRSEAAASLRANGFPARDEAWKYTRASRLLQEAFTPATALDESIALPPGPWGEQPRLVFVDGVVSPSLSTMAGSVMDQVPPELRGRFGGALSGGGFADLNLALLRDGAVLHLPSGPLHLVHVSTGGQRLTAVRHLLVADAGHAELYEHFVTVGAGTHLTTAAVEVFIGNGATVRHTRVLDEGPEVLHVATVAAKVSAMGAYRFASVILGSHVARVEVAVELAGEGAQTDLSGLALLRDEQHADHHFLVDHATPQATSSQTVRSVADGKSRSVYTGAVIVRKGAVGTDSQQLHQALLLSDDAVANTRPWLEIDNDDVSCAHGAAIGSIDEESLFYLPTTGSFSAAGPCPADVGFCGDHPRGAARGLCTECAGGAGPRLAGGKRMSALPTERIFDVAAVRSQFPILAREVNGRPLVYLDSAASAQKPNAVIDAVARYYREDHANVHRGVHTLSQIATAAYEQARVASARFLGANEAREVVFVRGCTEAINLVAHSVGQQLVAGDEIVVSTIEHHSNIVPWQLVAARTGAVLRVAPVHDDGSLDFEGYQRLLGPRTRMVSMVHVSNALGTRMPVRDVVEAAHAVGAQVMLDGAQAVVHGPVDVQTIGCDFYAFSGHKVYGPTGIGVLWGRAEALEALEPYQGGGEMIAQVSFDGSTWAEIPAKFEAGTPNIAGAVGLGAALDWVSAVGRADIEAYESKVLAHGTSLLSGIAGLRLIGTAPQKAGVLSFVVDGVHPQDLATLLDEQGIAVRTGHHCAEPAMRRFGVEGTIRASLGVYTTIEEMEALAKGVAKAVRILG